MSDYSYREVKPSPAQDDAEYERGRRERYPHTWEDQHPSTSTNRDYGRYQEHMEEAKRLHKEYRNLNNTLRNRSDPLNAPDVAQFGNADRKYLRGLEPGFHTQLIEPSLAAESSARSHADARAHFLDEHPYGYRTYQGRIEHEAHRDRAYSSAAQYSRLTAGHRYLASGLGRAARAHGVSFGAGPDYYLPESDRSYDSEPLVKDEYSTTESDGSYDPARRRRALEREQRPRKHSSSPEVVEVVPSDRRRR